MSIFVKGLDLGQIQDYTADVTVEAHGTKYQWPPAPAKHYTVIESLPIVAYDVLYCDRWKLGTKYKEIAADVYKMLQHKSMPRDRSYFACDQTGVGNAVMEMFSGMSPIGITITGQGTARQVAPQMFHAPKGQLVREAQVAFQNGQIRIAKKLIDDGSAKKLTEELRAFREKISINANTSFEAWRERDHDDLVLAFCIACWTAKLVFYIAGQRMGQSNWEDPPQISPI